jgi:hypothetical protein
MKGVSNMSETIVNLAKITQMLDADWKVRIYKNALGTYTARSYREKDRKTVTVDDFTPEQALTRLAYKVHDKIIDG